MKKFKRTRKLVALLLSLSLITGMMPATALSAFAADGTTGETTYVLAGSDFQAKDGHDAGVELVNGLLTPIKADFPTMDGFLFAGDYDVNYNSSVEGHAKLQQTVQSFYGKNMHEVYAEGNHDSRYFDLIGSTLSPSGSNDAEDYGVFVIHESDYMWHNNDENTVKRTAENLKTYLNAKRNSGYTKPIFVVSHLALNYSMRTNNDGDGKYAHYIFDVLNEGAEAGLNIIYLFGHNHSNGWDDYLGGAAVFLKAGDKINICQGDQTTFKEETLAFTYMNAGYVGYYTSNSSVDKTLTMSTFAITDDTVTINRYDANGKHNLKAQGYSNKNHDDSGKYSPNTATVPSPYTLTLNKNIAGVGEEITPPDSDDPVTRTYTRVKNLNELVSGGKYLLFYNGSKFMLPEVVEKSNDGTRKGFNLEDTSICGPDTIAGDYSAKEWTLTSSGSGWLLGDGTKYAKLTNTDNYKITATLENSGDVFSIGGEEDAFTFTSGSYVLNYNDRGLINGYGSGPAKFYIYRMTEEGSGDKVQTSKGWVATTAPVPGSPAKPEVIKYKYTLDTDGTVNDKEDEELGYLIVGSNNDYAMNASFERESVSIENNVIALDNKPGYEWKITSDNKITDGTNWLAVSNGTLIKTTNENSAYTWTIRHSKNGQYQIYIPNNNYSANYLRYSSKNKNFGLSGTRNSLRLFSGTKDVTPATDATEDTNGKYTRIDGELIYNVAVGTTANDAIATVKAGITGYEYEAMDTPGSDVEGQTIDDDALTWTLADSYDGQTPGEYKVTIERNGTTVGVAKVVVPSLTITGYSVEPTYGIVYKGTSQASKTGSYIYVQLSDNKYYQIPVTINMLTKADGSPVSTGEEATYEGLTLTYNGRVMTNNYTLKVVLKDGNHYPEYPHEGAVKVNKTAAGVDFQSSGVAKVELSASGVPVKKGADVIIVLDTSSSMRDNHVVVNGEKMSRLDVMKVSLKNLIAKFQQPGDDGEPLDIRVAVIDFNQYYPDSSSPYYIDSDDHLVNGSIRTNHDKANLVYTGDGTLSAGAFQNVQNVKATQFDNIRAQSGTNYDYALDAAYQLGDTITTDNANKGLDRDLYVIFMSDGAPFQYNYFSAQSGSSSSVTDARYWNNWLQGTLTDNMFGTNSNKSYYNEDGKHWMAEAIKGDKSKFYNVIRKNNVNDTDGDNWVQVQGLGATIYSIGFCLEKDKEITVESMVCVLQNIASSSKGTYYRTDTYEGLNEVFTAIGSDITYAASEARFVDTMGSAFDLQMGIREYLPKGETDKSKMQTISPTIEVKTYDIYNASEVNDTTITKDMIGKRKGTSTTNEVVVFNTAGTAAYSTVVDVNGDGKFGAVASKDEAGNVTYTINPEDNILDENGVINAKTFWYNAGSSAQMIDRNHDGETDYRLAPETFYWNIDTIKTQEVALSYYVYLTGSMEGNREAGSYKTNESAVLYYTNYLGKDNCEKVTTSPVLGWESANVSYAFYLVDEEGRVVVNQTTGATGTFANKIAVTSPVIYKEIQLNNAGSIEPMEVAANGVLPEGYEVYDKDAVYTVNANSNVTGSWTIVKGTDKVDTTYVTNFGGSSQYSNAVTMSEPSNDYTHTTVWFGVVWKPRTIDDAVVVDYGLPVDINVLGNDMFGDHGKLNAVGAKIPGSISRALYLFASDFSVDGKPTTSLTTTHGKVNINGNKVRYQLDDMEMNSKDSFAYEVNYQGTHNPGYYYGQVTVIPATIIYYEDSFVDFASYTKDDGSNEYIKDTKTKWLSEGDTKDAVQDEDRPDKYHLPTVDANNVYGYDSAYTDTSLHSLGSAQKIDVTENTRGEATFSFYGTGFDIVGLTSNTTGTLIIQVKDAEGNNVKTSVVDTYYGYAYNEETAKWETVASDNSNALYQIPVMKISGLTYGKYTVILTAGYNEYFDHTSDDRGDYSLYIDAIRIYDPANDGIVKDSEGNIIDKTVNDAYEKDGEAYPVYFEVRDKLIDKQTFDSLKDEESVSGIVFIDGKGDTANIGDYEAYGPNNEVYLQSGEAVAFDLNAAKSGYKVKSVQIAVKTVGGEGAVVVYGAEKSTTTGKVTTFNCLNETIGTATDMYYDITALDGKTVVIKNAGSDTSATISITNVKATYTKDVSTKMTSEQRMFTLTRASVETAIATLNAPEEPDTPVVPDEPSTPVEPGTPDTPADPSEPEEPEVIIEKAEIKSVKADKKTYNAGDTVKVTVKTDTNAKYVTVNGKKITKFKTSGDTRSWSYSVKVTKGGTKKFTAVAYNEADEPSKEVEATVTVKKFAPKTFKLAVNKKSVTVGDKVKATVTTSKDVKYVTINGKKVTKFKSNKSKTQRTWTAEVKASKSGKSTIKAVAYNSKGGASKEITKNVTVKKFTPKTFKVTLSKSTVKKGAKYTVTVTTSKDVKYVKVDGKKITKYTYNKKKGTKTFKATYKAGKTGKKTIKVVSYSKKGYASNAKSKTVNVKKK